MAATEICGESLSERLRRALAARDGCVRLQGLGAGAGPVLLDFEEAVVWTPEAGIQGRDSCRDIASRFASLDMQPLISARPEGLHSQPLLQFLWLLGVYADTQGRLLAPLTEGAQVRLKNWPDFRLLARNPNDFRIAAALVRNAYDVPTLAAALQLSAHRVASFVNAAYLCNLVAPLQAVRPQPLVAHAARSATNNRLAGLWQRVRSGLLRAS